MALILPDDYNADFKFIDDEAYKNELINAILKSNELKKSKKVVAISPLTLDNFNKNNQMEINYDEKQSENRDIRDPQTTESEVTRGVNSTEELAEPIGTEIGSNLQAISMVDQAGLSGDGSQGNVGQSDLQHLEEDITQDIVGFDFSSIEDDLSDDATVSLKENEIDDITQDIADFDFSSIGDDLSDEEDKDFSSIIEPQTTIQDTSMQDTAVVKNKGYGGVKTLFWQNIEVIKRVKEIKNQGIENYTLTEQDKNLLESYVGWGRLDDAFYDVNNEVKSNWEIEAETLKSLLSDEQYTSARKSVLNANYTPDEVVNFLWKSVEQMGFESGKVLEPSIGNGRFIKNALDKPMQWVGVELDELTSDISKILYGQTPNKIIQSGFQDLKMKKNQFDLVIGNPPFGSNTIHDTDKNLNGLSIHNYFFAKSLNLLKTDGILAMVCSTGLMDAKNNRARELIGKSANLVSAFRLPKDAFKDTVTGGVTSDIIFLQKINTDFNLHTNIDKWLNTTDFDGQLVNQYFIDHPENILGNMSVENGAFDKRIQVLSDGGDMFEKMDTILNNMYYISPSKTSFSNNDNDIDNKEIIEDEKTNDEEVEPVSQEVLKAGLYYRANEHFVFDDKIYIKSKEYDEIGVELYKTKEVTTKFNSKMEEIPLKERDYERIKQMANISNIINDLRFAQIESKITDTELENIREKLNKEYDVFVKKYGFLNSQTNKTLFKEDINAFLLLSLEKDYDAGVSSSQSKKLNISSRKPSAKKAEIFDKRTQYPYQEPTSAESPKDGLLISLAEKSEINIPYISKLTNLSEELVVKTLEDEDLIFFDEMLGKHVTREAYLSGNVKEKLNNSSIERNVKALQSVIPEDLDATEIKVGLGANWVDEKYYQEFVSNIFDIDANHISVTYIPSTSTWEISLSDSSYISLFSKKEFGTDRRDPISILESIMNNKAIVIMDEGKVNEEETNLVMEKASKLKEQWDDFIFSDKDRREDVCQVYNDTFNVFAQREYNGSHLHFQGKVNDKIFNPRPSQKNAVWRILQGGSVLLDHVVGAGKTATAIMATMELKRMKKANKPLVVVPNHLISQWGKDWMALYPNSNILVVTEKDFEKKRRNIFFNKMMTGDWDAIIIGHSQLIKIQNDPVSESEMILEEKYLLEESLNLSSNNYSIRRMEKRMSNLDERLSELVDYERDDGLTFQEIGFDALFLDESHEYKNLTYQTNMRNVGGLGNPAGSKKAFDLNIKVKTIRDNTGGNNIVFLTGTPISNTIAEMYTLMRYLSPELLEQRGCENFDSWVKVFADVEANWELSATGEYKLKERLSKFKNIPELINFYKSFADVISNDDIKRQLADEGKVYPIPEIHNGKPENVIAPISPDQEDYMEELVSRAENKDDIMLKIISDASKAALDMRLIDNSYEDFVDSKVNQCVNNVFDVYQEWHDDKGTQLIFSDLSTPSGAKVKEKKRLLKLQELADQGDYKAIEALEKYHIYDIEAIMNAFSVYDDIKEKLIEKGIAEHEIAFIHDYDTQIKKISLFDKVNKGEIRVLIGSTQKMGAGTNVQEKIVALHNLGAPWRPSDLTQREGRGLRPGNSLYEKYGKDNFAIKIFRYATIKTLDAMRWQILENKQKILEQLVKGEILERETEDINSTQLMSASEMKAAASGNPLILEEIQLKQEIKKIESLKRGFLRNYYEAERKVDSYERLIEESKEKIPLKEKDLDYLKSLRPELNELKPEDFKDIQSYNKKITEIKREFTANIGDKVFTLKNYKEYADEILKVYQELSEDEEKEIGKFMGFNVSLFKGDVKKNSSLGFKNFYGGEVILSKNDEYSMGIKHSTGLGRENIISGQSIIRFMREIVNFSIESTNKRYKEDVIKAQKDLPVYKNIVEKGFDKEDELKQLKERYQEVLSSLRGGNDMNNDEDDMEY